MAKRNRYSDQQRAEALAALDANGGNVNRTARQLDIPEKTLRNWAGGRHHPSVAKDAEGKKADLADKLESLAHELVDLAPKKKEEATLPQLMTAAGIALDKMLLLRGGNTNSGGGVRVQVVVGVDEGRVLGVEVKHETTP